MWCKGGEVVSRIYIWNISPWSINMVSEPPLISKPWASSSPVFFKFSGGTFYASVLQCSTNCLPCHIDLHDPLFYTWALNKSSTSLLLVLLLHVIPFKSISFVERSHKVVAPSLFDNHTRHSCYLHRS